MAIGAGSGHGRMKIAFPYPAYWPYVRRGVERCTHDLATYLSRRGHEVHIITSSPGRPRVARDGDIKVTYLRQVGNPLIYRYAPRLRVLAFRISATRVLAEERADVIHLWSYAGITWAPLIRRVLGTPYLFHIMMPLYSVPPGFGSLVRQANRVMALTAGMAKSVQHLFNVACGVLPPPVDLSTFRPSAARDLARPQVLFPADLADPRKGGTLLLKAWNTVHRRCPEAVLVLAGPFGIAGWHTYHFENTMLARFDLVRDPAAQATIELRGPGELGSLPAWYSQAAVTVLPSIAEAFGMVLTESLACGTPVVTSAFGGAGEIVTSSEIGATVEIREMADLVTQSSADQLAEAILYGIDLSRRPATAERCREWAAQWSLDRVGAQEEALLSSMLAPAQEKDPVRAEVA